MVTPRFWRGLALLLVLTAVAGTVPASPAGAQDQRDASVGFYLEEAGGRPPICSRLEPPSCSDEDIQLSGELYTGYYAFLCVFNGSAQVGVAGLQCAIEFDDAPRSGVDLQQWTVCANGLEFPQDGWGDTSGDGNTITWNIKAGGCQREEPGGMGTGVTAVAGYFYVTAYSPDLVKVVPYEGGSAGGVTRAIKVADCGNEISSGRETVLENDHGGSVGFSDDGSVTGSLPCVHRIMEETTWGAVKNLYDNQ